MRVVVVGAGVIGLILAKELAQRSIATEVYDGKRSVEEGADKASGILSKTGLGHIGIDYRSAIVNELDGAVLHAGNESLRVKARSVQAYVLDRGKLAKRCLEEAERAGAEITFARRLGADELRRLANDNGNIIVGADGAVSGVAAAFGFPPVKEYVLTYKAEYSGASVEDSHSVELFFANKHARRFFGWSAPYSSDMVELGVGTSSTARRSSASAFADFINDGNVRGIVEGAERMAGHASIIPLGSRKVTVKGNVMLVGDAAGQVKATTGGGIIFGAACARVAADVINAHIEHGTALAHYEKMWRRQYGMDLKLHAALHNYYSSMGPRSLALLIRMSKLFGAEQFFSRYGDMDSPSTMLKRFVLRGLAE